MGGLLILALIISYLWLVYQIAKRVPWWAKPLIIIVAFLAVAADGYLGRKKLERMCKQEGGLHIYEMVEGVEGFEEKGESPAEFWITESGYLFIEGNSDAFGKVDRLIRQQNGGIILEKSVNPESEYYITYHNHEKYKKNYYIYNYKIVNKKTNKTLAEIKSFNYGGGWFDKFISKVYASEPSIRCRKPISRNTHFKYWQQIVVKESFAKPIVFRNAIITTETT